MLDWVLGTLLESKTKSNTGCTLKGSFSNGDDGFRKRPFKDKMVGKCRGPEVHRDEAVGGHPAQLWGVCEREREKETGRGGGGQERRRKGFPVQGIPKAESLGLFS